MPDTEPFSNPLPPPGFDSRNAQETSQSTLHHNLTNDDFRKLLMTPRVPSSTPKPKPDVKSSESKKDSSYHRNYEQTPDRSETRKQKKKYYASLKKLEENKLAELAQKYRDRAKERREGNNTDYQHEDFISSTAGYKAVAPDIKSNMDAAERRRRMIQESKFLGGDMEHTHLVKGLDYALLKKVRSEITNKEKESEEQDEVINTTKDKDGGEEETIQFRTALAKNICRVVFRSNEAPEKKDLFLPGRMAYVIDLDDEFAESDIPTTLLRSKADYPAIESQSMLSANDIIINKLTQILSYLRQGIHNKKSRKKDHRGGVKSGGTSKEIPATDIPKMDENIFDDVDEYVPTFEKQADKQPALPSKSYFEKPVEVPEEKKKPTLNKEQIAKWSNAHDMLEKLKETKGSKSDDSRLRAKLSSKLEREMPESYAECYPGAPETEDAVLDSDDEVDYSKMDMGNKKGPIGRWDFDTQEEYSDYMSNKEAMPKAAFQYGVKMADGRKTRRTGKKDEKTKLDRDLQKINQIIAKRKSEGEVGIVDMEYKRPRF